jgi:hypothetical protein
MKAIAILFLAALAVMAQTSAAPAAGLPTDQYRIGAGVAYDYYGKTGFASLADIDARVSPTSNIWYHVALEMTREKAVLKPGAEYDLVKSGYWGVSMFGDAGLATGSGATLGAFSGGGKLSYDFGSRLTKGTSHYYIEFAIKANYITGTGTTTTAPGGLVTTNSPVQPVFSICFTKGF